MERLTKHILSLLRLYDSVALPGIGFFNLEQVSACFDEVASIFYPPYFSVSFEISYVAEDNRLLDSYVRKEGVSKEEAWKMMKADIDRFLDLLEENEELVLNGLGTFVYQFDEIEFYPSFSLNISLPPIEVPKAESLLPNPIYDIESARDLPVAAHTVEEIGIKSEETPEEQPEKKLKEKSEERPSELPEEITEERDITPIERIENETESPYIQIAGVPEHRSKKEEHREAIPEGYYYHRPEYLYIPIRKSVAKIAACILLVIIVGFSAWMPYNMSNNSSGTASILPIKVSEKVEKTVAKPDTASASSQTKERKQADTTYVRPLLATTEDGEVVPGANSLSTAPYLQSDSNLMKYYAVVAALKTDREVDNFIDSNKEGANKFKIIRNKKIRLVTVSSSNDRQDIETQMPLIRIKYPKAWIFTMK